MQQKSRKKTILLNGMQTFSIDLMQNGFKWVWQKKKNSKTLNIKELCNMNKEAKP
jgi:hypothetical protein